MCACIGGVVFEYYHLSAIAFFLLVLRLMMAPGMKYKKTGLFKFNDPTYDVANNEDIMPFLNKKRLRKFKRR